MKHLRLSLLFSLGFALLLSLPAAAEVLVLLDGSRIETAGPFTLERPRVTFLTTTGQLGAVDRATVDIEATLAANQPEADADDSASADTERPAVTMYATSWCGYCRRARALFESLEIDFEEVDIDETPSARAIKNQHAPGCGVPVIVVGEEAVCGFNESRIRRLIQPLLDVETEATEEESDAEAAEAD